MNMKFIVIVVAVLLQIAECGNKTTKFMNGAGKVVKGAGDTAKYVFENGDKIGSSITNIGNAVQGLVVKYLLYSLHATTIFIFLCFVFFRMVQLQEINQMINNYKIKN